jgi:glyoxylase-like metal-dependent hydrolase (beta-lactamase superfamily II)
MFARDEYRAMEEENHPIFIDNVLPIMEARQAVLVDLDYALDDEIWLEPTPGHSAGHVAIHLKSGQHHSVMCGDLIHTPLQLAEPGWTPTFEYDVAASTKTRKTFLDTHCESDTLILTAHFPSPSIGHIIPRRSGYDFAYI